MTWELSYERINDKKFIVYENRSDYFDGDVKEKYGTITFNKDLQQYQFKKSWFVEVMLSSQISELEKIMEEIVLEVHPEIEQKLIKMIEHED